MKINTLEDLQDKLSSDLSWRKRELIYMKQNIATTNNPTLIRAGVALLSAHFEGFLRTAANYYVIYISNQNICNKDLKKNFFALQCKNKIIEAGKTEKTSTHTILINNMLELLSQKFHIRKPDISTESNPSSKIFREIMKSISLNFTNYETKVNYIDADLLSNRHKIVHGERWNVDADEYYETLTEILKIMDNLNNQIFEAAKNKEYLLSENIT
ncbi:MAE_28990/MAE_18760 family HEPN-like nuclease [Pectinatus sottacetonis]|uniref:MAE_28990/MAE_18760 family HEPN-like nuclease n=1 Tax=Pectinatus sottacetonis TaxID=1002795 RepID=UPI0018C5D575|nr:MAE_28990/MAE_18760 family HEPN-like nuclease [Pectinatus sottacetonis]